MNINRMYLLIGAVIGATVLILLLLPDSGPQQAAGEQALPPGHPDIGAMQEDGAADGPSKANVKPEFYRELERLKKKAEAAPETDTSEVLALAQMLYFSHKLEDAARYYERFHRAAPRHVDAMFDLTLVYFDLKRFDDAIQVTRKILSLEPGNTKALYNLGAIYASLEKKSEARAAWEKLISLAPASEDAARAREMIGKL